MLPAVEGLGLVNTCAIVEPEPALAPVIPPVIVPSVHVNVLAALEVRAILVVAPLHTVVVLGVVTLGFGLTVTVIAVEEPTQEPTVAVGVTL